MNNDACNIKRGDFIGVIGSFKPGGQEKAVLVLKVIRGVGVLTHLRRSGLLALS